MLILMVDDLPHTKDEYLAPGFYPHLFAITVDAALHHLYTKPITHLYLDNDLADHMEGIHILQRLCWDGLVPPFVMPTTRNPVALRRMTDVLSLDLNRQQDLRTGWWQCQT